MMALSGQPLLHISPSARGLEGLDGRLLHDGTSPPVVPVDTDDQAAVVVGRVFSLLGAPIRAVKLRQP